ncbi:MAG: tRNA epoxyqueuosine(34) reductase QueG [Dehalococcoidia bacterium]|nr:tRNA epoxyqueuosine(34) reductase QueG [Dehalococcoidia bacterium]
MIINENLTDLVKTCAYNLGFDVVRITSAEPFLRERSVAEKRIQQGFMDGLPWYTQSRVRRGTDPNVLLPGAKSIISVGLSYLSESFQQPKNGTKIARYAWGKDYHKVIKNKLKGLVSDVEERLAHTVNARWYVDDGPMLDRAVAQRSGIGWFGKNTNILTSSHGSWVFLGQLITDLDLDIDPPLKKDCGTCTLCIEACPTDAIVSPYVLDNQRCISHLTIENRGSISVPMRSLIGEWAFGCDICQEVCPVNLKAMTTNEESFQLNEFDGFDLEKLLEIDEEEFRTLFAGSSLRRAKLTGLKRNLCVVLGNLGDEDSVPVLNRALNDNEALVRSHAAWALGRIGGSIAWQALEAAVGIEQDQEVKKEILTALVMDTI